MSERTITRFDDTEDTIYYDGNGEAYTLLWKEIPFIDEEGGECVLLLNSDDELVVVESEHFNEYYYSEKEDEMIQNRLDFQDMDDELQ